jgi:hypothetical protein
VNTYLHAKRSPLAPADAAVIAVAAVAHSLLTNKHPTIESEGLIGW